MGELVAKAGVKKEKGRLYFLDKDGDVSSAPMSRGGRKKGSVKTRKEVKVGVERESGYLYYVGKDGNVYRAKMARGRK